LQVRLARAGLGPLLLPAKQNRCLVGMQRLLIATGTASGLLLTLITQGVLPEPALVAPLLQGFGRSPMLLGSARRIEVVIPAMAAQPPRGQLDNAQHVTQQCTVMADNQQTTRPSPQLFAQQLPAL
jgi:hypothetical protein